MGYAVQQLAVPRFMCEGRLIGAVDEEVEAEGLLEVDVDIATHDGLRRALSAGPKA